MNSGAGDEFDEFFVIIISIDADFFADNSPKHFSKMSKVKGQSLQQQSNNCLTEFIFNEIHEWSWFSYRFGSKCIIKKVYFFFLHFLFFHILKWKIWSGSSINYVVWAIKLYSYSYIDNSHLTLILDSGHLNQTNIYRYIYCILYTLSCINR